MSFLLEYRLDVGPHGVRAGDLDPGAWAERLGGWLKLHWLPFCSSDTCHAYPIWLLGQPSPVNPQNYLSWHLPPDSETLTPFQLTCHLLWKAFPDYPNQHVPRPALNCPKLLHSYPSQFHICDLLVMSVNSTRL